LREEIKALSQQLSDTTAEHEITSKEKSRLEHELSQQKDIVAQMVGDSTDEMVIALHEQVAEMQRLIGQTNRERDAMKTEHQQVKTKSEQTVIDSEEMYQLWKEINTENEETKTAMISLRGERRRLQEKILSYKASMLEASDSNKALTEERDRLKLMCDEERIQTMVDDAVYDNQQVHARVVLLLLSVCLLCVCSRWCCDSVVFAHTRCGCVLF